MPTRSRALRPALVLLAVTLFACVAASPQQSGSGEIELVPVFARSSFAKPVFLTSANDGSGRVFIVEQPGVIRVVTPGQGAAAVYLDIRDRVGDSGNEEGLLGLAFPSDFAETGHFFVYYTTGWPGPSRVSRFTATPDGAPFAASELVVLEVPQPDVNHNGGMIAFGPDGYLYVGLGDGGSADDPDGNGQDLGTLLGSVLRIDVRNSTPEQPYAIPADNPFVSTPGARPEIWAYGLRNPWRFAFDPANGDLWMGDVGQNAYEEIDVVTKGGNYGWNVMEGAHCFRSSTCDRAGLTEPVAEYGHDSSCSVTGGYVYRGSLAPSLEGAYVYADYCSGIVWALRPGGEPVQIADVDFNVSSFGEDAARELYVLDHGGAVYRIQQSGPVAPTPTPTSSATPTQASAPTPTATLPPGASPTPTLTPTSPSASTATPTPAPLVTPTPTATPVPPGGGLGTRTYALIAVGIVLAGGIAVFVVLRPR